MPHLKGLNPKQKEAALHQDGPLLIIAGAGAGKTKTITHRIINLIKNGVEPNKILAVTFTNKAAKEMKDRITKAIDTNFAKDAFSQVLGSPHLPKSELHQTIRKSTFGFANNTPFVATFHSLGVYIIKENARVLGLNKNFTILDEGDSISLIKEAIKESNLDPKQYEPRKIKNIISREKGKFTFLPDFQKDSGDFFNSLVAQIWTLYEKKKSKENSLDFDDLLLKSTELLKNNETIRKIYQEKWEYIHIDEYQDTNEVQYLMSKLLSQKHKNICVVGDSDQCLIKGTKIKMADGHLRAIEKIKSGDSVLSNYGSGNFGKAKVLTTKNKKFSGELVQIKTKKGNILTSTPEHLHFAGYRLNITPQMYLNYLMYKKNTGWRIGTTSIYTKGRRKSVVRFLQRSNQEHADALWIIGTHQTQSEARIQEYIFSLKYQIPTIPFIPRKGLSINGYVHDKNALQKIFSALNTQNSALKLLKNLKLSFDSPHHQPQSSGSNRRNINITLCADSRGKNPMHLISIFGNDNLGKKKLKSLGFSVRPAKKNTKNWRFETVRANYGDIYLLAQKLTTLFPEAKLVLSARLGGKKDNLFDHNSLPQIQAGYIMPGMALFTENGYDIVSKISRIPVSKINVFDLNIERTHNFIANGILTHNCIYSWRGANLKNILSFEKDYAETKIITLEENYRSTQNILEAANEIIKKNIFRPEKNLFTKNPVGEKISIFEANDENEEADFVATKILEILDEKTTPNPLLNQGGEQEFEYPFPNEGEDVLERTLGRSVDDGQRKFSAENFRGESENIFPEIAILYRTNFQSRVLEEAMLRYNIPYQVLGIKFFERKEIKDTLAYLRASLNPESLSDIKRIINFPARGIGKTTLLKLFAGQRNTLPIKMQIKINNFYEILEKIKEKVATEKASEVIKYVIKKTGIESELQNNTEEDLDRLANIKELATLAMKYDNLENGEGIEKLLEDASLASDQDSLLLTRNKKEEKSGVKLMTVHASKGLEFKYVFIVGLEDGLFPHQKQNEMPTSASSFQEAQEEERRLFYVALTRAKKKIFLSFANYRTIFGSRQINSPSEFIFDIPANLIEKGDEDPRIKTIYL
jgi:DNA helicase-2/ATP-dependent DNA helicase PcrA